MDELGPESVLSDAGGETAQDVRDRLDRALRFIANWYKATDATGSRDTWWPQIDAVRAKVEAAFIAMDPSKVFPGNDELAVYQVAQLAFPALWRELMLSVDTIPHPGLLDQAADLLGTIFEFPSYIIPKVADSISRAVGGALGKTLGNLWPYLALAGVGVGAYFIVKAKVLR